MADDAHTAGCNRAFEERDGYLYVFISGAKDSLENWAAIAAECRARNATRLLVEEDFATLFSTTEMFVLLSQLPELLCGIKVAHVDRRPDHHDRNRFGTMVASNRGAYCETFRTMPEAEAWLLAS